MKAQEDKNLDRQKLGQLKADSAISEQFKKSAIQIRIRIQQISGNSI